jgi:hypothetical protein
MAPRILSTAFLPLHRKPASPDAAFLVGLAGVVAHDRSDGRDRWPVVKVFVSTTHVFAPFIFKAIAAHAAIANNFVAAFSYIAWLQAGF